MEKKKKSNENAWEIFHPVVKQEDMTAIGSFELLD